MGVTTPISEILLVFVCLQNSQIFPSNHGLYIVHGVKKSKNELLQKFMQVEVVVKYMEPEAKFGRRGISGFGDIVTFQIGHISLSNHGL